MLPRVFQFCKEVLLESVFDKVWHRMQSQIKNKKNIKIKPKPSNQSVIGEYMK